ncbi:MAG: hypothetical protein Q9165_005588 [Trypethelium subeluteriae]
MLFHHSDVYGVPSTYRRVVCCEVEEDVFFAGVMEPRFGQQLPRVLIKGPPAAEIEGALEGLMELVCQKMAEKLEECEEYVVEKRDMSPQTRDTSRPTAFSWERTANGLEPLHLAPDHFPLAPWSAVQVGMMPGSDKTNREFHSSMESTPDWNSRDTVPYLSIGKPRGWNEREDERQVPKPVHSRFSSNSSNGPDDLFPAGNVLEESGKETVAYVSDQEGKTSDVGRVEGRTGKANEHSQSESKSTAAIIPAQGIGKSPQSAPATIAAASAPVRNTQDTPPPLASRPSLDPFRQMELALKEQDFSTLLPCRPPPPSPLQTPPSKSNSLQPSQGVHFGPDRRSLLAREEIFVGRQRYAQSHLLNNKPASTGASPAFVPAWYPTTQAAARPSPVAKTTADLPLASYRAISKEVAQSKVADEKDKEYQASEAFRERALQVQKQALETALRAKEVVAAKRGKSKDDAVLHDARLQGSGMSMTDQMIAGAKARLEAHKRESDRRTESESSAAGKSDESRRGSWTTMDSDSERSA